MLAKPGCTSSDVRCSVQGAGLVGRARIEAGEQHNTDKHSFCMECQWQVRVRCVVGSFQMLVHFCVQTVKRSRQYDGS